MGGTGSMQETPNKIMCLRAFESRIRSSVMLIVLTHKLLLQGHREGAFVLFNAVDGKPGKV